MNIPDDVFANNRIKLTAKTRKGKNRIKELGADWEIIGTNDKVSCLDNEPGFAIAPIGNSDEWRWVKVTNDPDFTWETE